MADDLFTVADMIADALNLADNEVSDLQQASPLIAALPAEEASDGDYHRYSKEVGAPTIGFRSINEGIDQDHSVDILVEAQLKIIDVSWKVDKALADRRRGKNKGREWLIAREGRRRIRQALFVYEQQAIKGQVGGDANGFEGMADQASLASLAGSMVVNAGGAVANQAGSVYAIRMGEDDLSAVYNGDQPFDLGDTIVTEAMGTNDKPMPVYYTPGCSWLGLQVGALRSIARIVNLAPTKTDGKYPNGLNDDLIAELLTKGGSGRPYTHLVMSREARLQLQNSRTATTTSGAPAPMPTESHGAQIMVTDALAFDEAVIA